MWEPYRIKVVEPLPRTTRQTRMKVLERAGYNPFLIPAKYVTIDLISDSGTGAMTSAQWAAMIDAREDFAGQTSFEQFIEVAESLTGLPHIQPVHQGRGAERILFGLLLEKGDTVFANTHFETTRGNIEWLKCRAIDLPSRKTPFCGNIDLDRMQKLMKQQKKVKLVILTVTNNILGGQPVSMENIAAAKQIARRHGALLVLDASRFADNAFLVKEYGKMKGSINAICRKMFGYADIVYLSNKKDGLVNIGGFIGLRDRKVYERLRYEIIRQESFPTSGGLAARDLAAMTHGLLDSTNEHSLRAHIESIRFLGQLLKENHVDIFDPIGGHAVVILPKGKQAYSAFALASRIYIDAGIRVGVFDDSVRVAVPRRVYTREHLRHVAGCIAMAYSSDIRKLKLIYKPDEFFNFFARYKTV